MTPTGVNSYGRTVALTGEDDVGSWVTLSTVVVFCVKTLTSIWGKKVPFRPISNGFLEDLLKLGFHFFKFFLPSWSSEHEKGWMHKRKEVVCPGMAWKNWWYAPLLSYISPSDYFWLLTDEYGTSWIACSLRRWFYDQANCRPKNECIDCWLACWVPLIASIQTQTCLYMVYMF